jgi:Secretion system C-terminal sorting domain
MKQIISVLTLIAAFTFVTASFANTSNINPEDIAYAKVEIKGSDISKTLFIEFANEKEEDVTISIMNEEGATIHTDKAKSIKAFSKKFNFPNLVKGEYILKIVRENCKITQVFAVTNKGIVVKENNRKEVYSPTVVQVENKFDVTIPVIKNKYSVLVLNVDGAVIFEDSKKGLTELTKRYNMETLPKGEYLIQISIDGESYFHNFSK